ncbi:hypothetical protein FACUT_727 [Fusarium acutatum]|uniref:Uncharacterized protein n=1 Tax=Fusarium acutatum TaxID=78861 RepID=A0A8H4P0N1_9HYPO|nr:hypothetical protein FACUT_727 [Fusarium acutatum]
MSPRGYIGYLVGYTAHNIYRIWILRLEKVVERSEQLLERVFKSWILNLEDDDDEIDLPDRPIQVIDSEGLNSGVEVTAESSASPLRSATEHRNQHAPIQITNGLQTPEATPELSKPNAEGDDRSIPDTYVTSESFTTAEVSESLSAQLQTELEALRGEQGAPQSLESPLQSPQTLIGDTIVVAGDYEEEDNPLLPLQGTDDNSPAQ